MTRQTDILPATDEPRQARLSRLEWLDLFRGLAVILMIETHATNSFLKTELRQTNWFVWLNFINGLVAPSFLFIAGYANGLAMRRREKRSVPWKRIRRLLTIALVGYALHFPWTTHIFNAAALQTMFQADILQCLAMSLLVMLVMEVVAVKPERIECSHVVLLLIVVLAAPWLATMKAESLWALPFAAYLNQQTGSLFPLFPWMGFALAGALASRIQLPQTARLRRFDAAFLGCGTVSGLVMWSGVFNSWTPHRADATNPGFFFERLGWLFVLMPCFVWLQRRVSPRLLVFAGRESLALYVIHLLLLYGFFWNGGSIAGRIGCTKSFGATMGLFAALLAVSLALTCLFAKVIRWKKT